MSVSFLQEKKKTDIKRKITARFIGWIDPVKVVILHGKSVVVLRRNYPLLHPKRGMPTSCSIALPLPAGRIKIFLLLHSRHHLRRVFLSDAHNMKHATIKSTGIGIDHHSRGIYKSFLFPYFHAEQGIKACGIHFC